MPGPISGAAAEPHYPASLGQEPGPKCLERQAEMAFRGSIRNPVLAPTFTVDLEENSIWFRYHTNGTFPVKPIKETMIEM